MKYDGTTGLWALVMMSYPPESSYTQNDLQMHIDLVYRTNVMDHPHNVVLRKRRYKKTKKWMHIFPILKTSVEDDNANHDDTDDAAFEDSFQHASWLNKNNDDGDGIIQFLPGDIKGLETKLNYLLGELGTGRHSPEIRLYRF